MLPDRKFLVRMLSLYGLIVIASNVMAVFIPSVVSIPVFSPESTARWEAFLSNNRVSSVATFFAFLVPVFFCFFYAHSIFRSEEKFIQNIAEVPSIFSLSSVIGWNLYYFIEIPFVLYARAQFGILIKAILITSWGFSVFSGMTAWTLSYLLIEMLNRAVLLPRVFPEGHIQRKRISFRPSFKHLMIFCFMVSSLFPIMLLITSLIAVHVNNNLPLNMGIVYVSIILLFLALAITLSLSRLILNPLNKLTTAAGKIKDGDYKSRVPIVTADELGTLADSFNEMSAALLEKEFMRDTFGKVVDPEVRDYLLSGAGKASIGAALGGETREVTVLFCDIRSFTAMSEKMEASEVVSLLNRYFTVLGQCITNNHGIINKYIGDAIMAIFGAPVESANSAQDAFNAACDMKKALADLNREFASQGLSELRFGIGIHTGSVFAGTIGAENRMEYTVIGDTVNTASRLESLCKTYKTDLLVSAASAALQKTPLTFVAEAEIRGKTEPMKVYSW